MAKNAGGQRFCKVIKSEGGETQTITIRGPKGHKNRRESLSISSDSPSRGEHKTDVYLSPKDTQNSPLIISKRDVFYIVLGFFFFELITALAQGVAIAFY